jgi:hypothetical protein
VVDRTAAGSPELAELRLVALGRADGRQSVSAGTLTHTRNRVEIRRPGVLEWFENSAAGLEQGFTLERKPAGKGPLTLALAVAPARASLRGDSVVLATPTGRRLGYGKLAVSDATGAPVAAHFAVAGAGEIHLIVDDTAAPYPLVVDPLLTETADSQLESDQANAELGISVASAGDVDGDGYADVIVGANLYDAGQSDEGAAFVFLGSATGVADGDPTSAAAQLESDQAGAELGISVASAGDVDGDGYADVIVGANLFDNPQIDEGAAFVFLGSATGVADGDPTSAAAQLESDQADAELGISVAGAGDVDGDGYADVIVGANGYDNGEAEEGAAFVFLGSATGVADGDPTNAAAQLESDQADAELGVSVAGAGDVDGDGYADVIVGANLFDAVEVDEGAAFVYRGGAAGIADGNPATAAAGLESDQIDASMGRSVAGAGDVNGDGYGDVIVGAYMYDAGEADEGAAFVFLGSATGIGDGDPISAHAQLESDQADARMGESVSGAGDVNGDGYADVIVGAWRYDSGEADEGAAFVFLGSSSGIADGDPTTAHAQLESNQVSSRFGFSVASAGDVDGDGYADVIVGSSFYNAGEIVEGAAFVFPGSASGIADGNPATAVTQLESNQIGAQFGHSVAGAGDVDGDGYADVIVGAPTYDEDQTDEGAAFVFVGSALGVADGDPSTAQTQLESTQDSSLMGSSVAGAGDVDGDGYADVIVGATNYSAGEAQEGIAVVFLGSSTGVADGDTDTAATRLVSNQVQAFLGRSVAGAGDVNGDGYADVIVGAYEFDAGESDEGAAFVLLGSPTGIPDSDPTTASALLEADQADAFLGWSVAGVGDVNGDGFADVIAGAPFYDAGEDAEGIALVFLGNDNRNGRPVMTRQFDSSDSSEAQPWGTSSGNEFDAVINATHPAGRGRVKLEVETCPPGAAFDSVACGSQTSAVWTEIIPPATSAVLTETITGLTADTLYRWRARVLHAPANVTATGITPPPNPAHGPWRRIAAQGVEADIRVLPEPGTALSLSAGIALLGLLHRRRRASA